MPVVTNIHNCIFSVLMHMTGIACIWSEIGVIRGSLLGSECKNCEAFPAGKLDNGERISEELKGKCDQRTQSNDQIRKWIE
ncbi:unnamed protein product [Onchocerca ochengi]|uniref:Secreted protein n=1 Tax=Onchocerca ochengi TaxID=42157 RepID=A0A182EE70_ONCOC|nr:unnamed protein product [Onchocerca ochengi]